ncbi:MAG: lamin tail domain-containing protein [bacterium]
MVPLLVCLLAAGRIVVTEVMSNPAGADGSLFPEDRNEFVELYNAGDEAVDLRDWTLDDGDALDRIAAWADSSILAEAPHLAINSTWLPPGWYAVVLDPEYTHPDPQGGWVRPYRFGPNVLALTVGNTTLGNGLAGNDPVIIASPCGDTTTFGTPFDPADSIPCSPPDGVSWERLDVLGPDRVDNWRTSPDPAGSTPGAANAASTLPDLAIAALELVDPDRLAPDAGFTVRATVANRGYAPVENWRLELFIDANGNARPDPAEPTRAAAGWRLTPGADSTLGFSFTAPRLRTALWAILDCPGDADTADNRRRVWLDPGGGERRLRLAAPGFSPDGDGIEDSLAISYRLPAASGRLRVQVYDLAGRLVRDLHDGRPEAAEGELHWNGRAASGRAAPAGLYAVRLRWTGPGAAAEEQLPVALYR